MRLGSGETTNCSPAFLSLFVLSPALPAFLSLLVSLSPSRVRKLPVQAAFVHSAPSLCNAKVAARAMIGQVDSPTCPHTFVFSRQKINKAP